MEGGETSNHQRQASPKSAKKELGATLGLLALTALKVYSVQYGVHRGQMCPHRKENRTEVIMPASLLHHRSRCPEFRGG